MPLRRPLPPPSSLRWSAAPAYPAPIASPTTAEQDTNPGSMLPADARPEADPVANMMTSAAEDLDSRMPIATQAGAEQHDNNVQSWSEYTMANLPGFGITPPQLIESCPPYPVRSGPNYRAYHAQKDAAWSPDGKCVLQLSEDRCLRTHLMFEPPSRLIGVHESPESIRAFAAAPLFDSDDPMTMCVLASVKEEPIRLFNINDPNSEVYASYPLMYDTDDVLHIPVDCIKVLPNGHQFVAAGANCLARFDIEGSSSKPVEQLYTHNKCRKKNKLNPYALSSKISAIDYRYDGGVLAVGTWGNKIGFYEDFGVGEVMSVDYLSEMRSPDLAGGVQTLRWSPDGNYLYICERMSDLLTILDVRMALRQVSFLTGRHAMSKQRHGFDIMVDDQGHHVIAGGSDGAVRVWHNPTARSEEFTGPDVEWQAHDDHIAAVAVNPIWPDFLVTTAGSRHFPAEEDYDISDSSETDEDSDMDDDSSEEDSDTIDSIREEDSDTADESNGGESRHGVVSQGPRAPVPNGWMKLWRWDMQAGLLL
ncbi:wd repeat-containing protein [Diplodia corticola]|uniref:Wd repeat-containing protein n=1 Tax=Diplodia corticola TaxID=236234 RepID=A0A1J9SGQ6_9PEZI|nr:wd repeat-containing protein [Diplodia corticola]OJD38765.1 wd repeat-containing protein [Diplodia corticola]